MPTRREFLKIVSGTTAGIFFAGCCCADSSLGFTPSPPQTAAYAGASRNRREVVVGGRRTAVVDVHAHARVPEVWDLVKDRIGREGRAGDAAQASPDNPANLHNGVEKRLADLDEMGIDVQALSINPFWYWADVDLARKIIQLQNEKLAELCAAHPKRFVGLGSVALQHPSLAVEQMEEGVKKFDMRGFAIGGSVNGDDLSAEKFHPIWAKAEELQTLIFIHPQAAGTPIDEKRLQGNGFLDNVVGHPLETTLALTHLIQDGTLDLFPRLKICAAHGGGYLPSYSSRNDQCLTAFPNLCKPLKKPPTEYLKQLYFDSVLFTPEDMRHLIAVVGASQVVVGTDYPTLWNRTPVDRILAVPGLNDDERISIFGNTAAKLLKISI
ncbi:MAG TPA: amidohydrolase family protein [Candidatus Acidoferrum sp.]|jgi:aminocarboxymuconate-semialdehyde decarboxylase|nr:amidohydrolase family protein [Candidatus Acidoferrum sp.]